MSNLEQLSIEPAGGPEEVTKRIESGNPVITAWRRLKKIPTAVVAWVIISLMLALAIASLLGVPLTPYSFDQTSTTLLADPSWQHLMGTDELGRDVLTRVIYGSRLSISIGITTALVALVIGTVYGATAGYCEGKVDSFLMRGVDIAYSLPDLLVMILVGVLVGRGTQGILFALALVSWMGTARLVRAQFMQLKHEEFIEAARACGQPVLPLICKHFLPNAMGPIIVALTFIVPSAILSESTLSFIGLGLSPPACSWGTLAADGWRSLRTHPHLILFPSLFIFLTVLSFNFLGDGLRDALDPRTRLKK
ncbi:MAG: ABC transporter permease [Candidatus Obscuribacterales bacterium]|nr:ABC transporter permease [Candidatus Obscuribacterales bacterium]